jgi:hypothetical protein
MAVAFWYFDIYLENLISDMQNILGLCQQWINETNTKDSFLGEMFL